MSGNIVKRIFAAPFDILGFGTEKKDFDEKKEKEAVKSKLSSDIDVKKTINTGIDNILKGKEINFNDQG